MDNVAHDQIFLVLPDGREVIGRALKVNKPVHIDEGPGVINARFAIDAGVPPMDVCAVLMVLDKPMRERIILR